MAQAPQVLPGVPDLWHAALQMDEPAALRLEIRPGVPLQSLDDFYSWEDEESVQARSLLHLAALLNASSCAKALLHAGASPNLRSPTDGKTPVHCACINAGSPQGAVLLASLLRNGGDIATVEDFNGLRPSDILAQPHLYQIDTCPHINRIHDWGECPYLHPGEKARRRDPRLSSYQALPCPEFRKGMCRRGDACPFAHGVFECWLHPTRYRTTLCKEGAACSRPVCFFAHSVSQLREATVPVCSPTSSTALAPIATSRFTKTPSDSSLSPGSPGSTLQQGLLGSICSSSAGNSRCASPGAVATAAAAMAESLRQSSMTPVTSFTGLSAAPSMDGASSSYSCSPMLSENLDTLLMSSEGEAAAVAAAVAARAQQQQAAAAAQAQAVLNRLLQTASWQGSVPNAVAALPAVSSMSTFPAAFSTSPPFVPPLGVAEQQCNDVGCDVAALQQLMNGMGF